MDKEFRNIELRALEPLNLESRTIVGTAIVFNQLSNVISIDKATGRNIREIIDSKAITQELLDKSDIKLLYNHNDSQVVLARWNKGNGTLQINLTETGVDFSFEAKNNSAGQVILDAVRSGDVDSCSFSFYVKPINASKSIVSGEIIQTILLIEELYDFSIVSLPAYPQTTVYARMIEIEEQENIKEQEKLQVEKEIQERTNKERLENYYKALREKFLN